MKQKITIMIVLCMCILVGCAAEKESEKVEILTDGVYYCEEQEIFFGEDDKILYYIEYPYASSGMQYKYEIKDGKIYAENAAWEKSLELEIVDSKTLKLGDRVFCYEAQDSGDKVDHGIEVETEGRD